MGSEKRSASAQWQARMRLGLKKHPIITTTGVALFVGATALLAPRFGALAGQRGADVPLPTGKFIAPQGTQTQVGSLPVDLALTPDGRYLLVSSIGQRTFLSALDAQTGKVVSQLPFGEVATAKNGREGLYYGITFGVPGKDGITAYVSRGAAHTVTSVTLGVQGNLTEGLTMEMGGNIAAGLAIDSGLKSLYVADNSGDPGHNLTSTVSVLNLDSQKVTTRISVPGYPYAVVALTKGAQADKKVYVSSEQSALCVVDVAAGKLVKEIRTGEHPMGLRLNKAQDRLYVANTGSDTVSVVRTDTDRVEKTILLRPADARGIAGATPTALALSPDEKTLYVTLSDMNAVAVVDLGKSSVQGYIPVGWCPTSLAIAQDGKRLFVANAKGVLARNPNGVAPAYAINGRQPRYIESVMEGTVSSIDLSVATRSLADLTRTTLANNRIVPNLLEKARTALQNPGIKHVFYIVKENRTYDQVLSDLPRGNGDKSLLLFGKDVTPNEHALAERFVLLDNFYCSGEVSGDGWNWSTSAMSNPYNTRVVNYGYTGHSHPYNYEGSNHGVAVDLYGINDVSRSAGGYIWDAAIKSHVSLRNYGFFCDDLKAPRKVAVKGAEGPGNAPTKKALIGLTDRDFRGFDMEYADSDAWVKLNLKPAPKQKTKYGTHNAPSRFSEWKREFDGYVKNGNLPALNLVRFGNDHTDGTSAGNYTPAALVADNDYAVGQLVEAISHSPYWTSSAIFVLEDDAQAGYDHVDAHRSIAFVISPYIAQGTYDNHFYNTDSVIHTMGSLLGFGPLCQYDAGAPVMNFFGAQATNSAPYTAILPKANIVGKINGQAAYRGRDSRLVFNPTQADTGNPIDQSEILWHAVRGASTPVPARYSRSAQTSFKEDKD